MKLTKSGLELKEVIEKAMKDQIITNNAYEEIMKVANKDGMVDDHEQRLLSQLQELLENGTVDRVKGQICFGPKHSTRQSIQIQFNQLDLIAWTVANFLTCRIG
jgi:hypothetical protein